MQIEQKFKIGNSYIILSKGAKIKIERIGKDLLFVYKNKDKFINDLRINRYLKKLKADIQKNMVTACTQGFGTSSAFYYISQSVLLDVLSDEKKRKELARAQSPKQVRNAFDTAIKYIESDIKYFSQSKFVGKYFSVNGQHRMDSIIADMNGDLKKVSTEVSYAPLSIIGLEEETLHFESFADLKKKLCSVDSKKRFKTLKAATQLEGEQILEWYLSNCDVMIEEIQYAESFEDICTFIWYSNSSTSWTEFEHAYKQVKNPYTSFVANEISTDDTSKFSEVEKLIYIDSGIDWETGKFKRTSGGFEYLCAITFDTAFNPDSVHLLEKFGFRTQDEMRKSILDPSFVADESVLKDWKATVVAVAKVFKKLNSEESNPIAKEILKKPSSFINSIFLLSYLKKIYKHAFNNGNYKVKVHIDNYETIIKNYCNIAVMYNNPMNPINTYFWETTKGIEMLEAIGQPGKPFTSVNGIKDPSFRKQFEDFKLECLKHKRDKSDSSVAFAKHIGDSFTFGWAKDHSCVVNQIKSHLEIGFNNRMIELKQTGIFGDVEWEDTTPLPSNMYLLPDSEDEEQLIQAIWTGNSHRGHKTAKSKGGSNKADNIELENAEINVISKNVV